MERWVKSVCEINFVRVAKASGTLKGIPFLITSGKIHYFLWKQVSEKYIMIKSFLNELHAPEDYKKITDTWGNSEH